MDFRELTYITAVADAHSVTEAARQLFISQPSLSYIIAKVEENLGVKLFDRKTSPLSLTYAGERYVKTAREILRLRDNLRREMNDIGHGAKGRINVGIPTERAGFMLPKAIPIFRQKYPNVEIRLEESRSEELIRNLMIDKIVFCIIPGSHNELPPGLVTEFIYKEKLFLVAGKETIPSEMIVSPSGKGDGVGFPVVNLKKMPRSMPFIMQKQKQFVRGVTDDLFRRIDFFPKEIMEVSSSITALQLAEAGMGLAVVPERAIRELGGFDRFHCFLYNDEPETWDVNVIYKKDVYLANAERALINSLKEAFAVS